jgi:hypothetical protein
MKNAKATNYVTSKEIALKGLSLTAKNGGATIDPKTGDTVTTGYAVGGIREFKFYNARLEQLEEITEAIKKIRLSHPKMKVGFWLDGGTLYLDAVAVMNSEESARIVAETFDEIAFFNLDTKEEIRLK